MTTVLLSEWTNTLYGIYWASVIAPYPAIRFIPHRHFCLPKLAHSGICITQIIHTDKQKSLHIQSLRIGRMQHAPDSLNHSLHVVKFEYPSYPEGNFEGNQLLHGSISLSSLYPDQVWRTICMSLSIWASHPRFLQSFALPDKTVSTMPLSQKKLESQKRKSCAFFLTMGFCDE